MTKTGELMRAFSVTRYSNSIHKPRALQFQIVASRKNLLFRVSILTWSRRKIDFMTIRQRIKYHTTNIRLKDLDLIVLAPAICAVADSGNEH